MNLEKMISLFVNNAITNKKYNENNTLNKYKAHLQSFRIFLLEGKCKLSVSIDEISLGDIDDFALSIKSRGVKNKTVNVYLASIKTFFKRLKRRAIGTFNPEEIEYLKREYYKREFLSCSEVEELLTLPEMVEPKKLYATRNKLIFRMLYCTGLRVSELIGVEGGQIESDNSLVIFGKGGKYRRVFLDEDCLQLIEEYESLKPRKSSYLFIPHSNNSKGNHISRNAIEKIFEKYRYFVTHDKHLCPHIMRCTFATHLLHQGVPIVVIKELLGHEHVSTTETYLTIEKRTLGKATQLLPIYTKEKDLNFRGISTAYV